MASPSASTPVSRPRRVHRRAKTTSCLQGMFDSPESSSVPSSPSLSSVGSLPTNSLEEDRLSLPKSNEEEFKPMTLREMTRSLRKAKRQLLLHSVSEQQKSSVDQMREIILKIAQDTDDLSLSSNDSLLGGVPAE